jgi:hypothetical protein
MSFRYIVAFSIVMTASAGVTRAQQNISSKDLAGQQNVVTTMVPFLTITPDSRSGGMGDVGVAISPDANSIHWNMSKLSFAEKKSGLGISYAPWLRSLVPDVQFSYLSAYNKVGKNGVLAGSFRYFSLGNINFTDFQGDPLGSFNPNEFALDGGYATRLSENFSVGVVLRFIRSNIAGVRQLNGISTRPGIAGAGDINLYYTKKTEIQDKPANVSFGVNFQNIGSKMTYTNREQRDFIPMNLKFGGALDYEIDEYNRVVFAADVNKLLVPTRPYYVRNWQGGDSLDMNGNRVILGGDPNVPVIQGLFQSFSDAPGGFREELREYNWSIGLEYWYNKKFAARAGYFNEPATKGNRKYLTFGFGVRYKVIGIDAAYLVPFQQRHPLANQLRFSMLFDFAAFSDKPNN